MLTLIHIPMRFRNGDVPPVTPASIAAAKAAAQAERRAVLTSDQVAVLDAQDAIERLADRLGSYRRLARIVRNLAAMRGEEV